MELELFVDRNPTLDTSWRSIILLGRNVASYKFALAKSLLECDCRNEKIEIENLAIPFARNICEHLKKSEKQITTRSSTFLEACKEFNDLKISEDELRKKTVKLGFVNVIDAFHNVAGKETPRFFVDKRSKSDAIVLTDNFYKLKESDLFGNLNRETESRWNLWETAISLNVNPTLLEIIKDENKDCLYVLNDMKQRKNVTSARDALIGYQKGKCFFCYKNIWVKRGHENSCEVDHFFPNILKRLKIFEVDQIWDLVLTCQNCNRGTGGKFDKIPDMKYLYQLNKRNNYYIGSNHPLRETIINQTGESLIDRRHFLQKMWDKSTESIPAKWKPIQLNGESF